MVLKIFITLLTVNVVVILVNPADAIAIRSKRAAESSSLENRWIWNLITGGQSAINNQNTSAPQITVDDNGTFHIPFGPSSLAELSPEDQSSWETLWERVTEQLEENATHSNWLIQIGHNAGDIANGIWDITWTPKNAANIAQENENNVASRRTVYRRCRWGYRNGRRVRICRYY